MNTIFRSANQTIRTLWAPVAAHPLLARSLQLVLTLALYAGGAYAVALVSGEARLPLVLYAVYFLPAVLRAWLQFYWRLRDDVKALGGHRGKTNKAL